MARKSRGLLYQMYQQLYPQMHLSITSTRPIIYLPLLLALFIWVSCRANVTILITKPTAEYCTTLAETKSLPGIDPGTSRVTVECRDQYTKGISSYYKLIFHVI